MGLIRLFEATGDEKYAVMAGLASSWLTGNNVAGRAMYDPDTGRGYDGIGGPHSVNLNAGAESTIEALFSILEVERFPLSKQWLFATGEIPGQKTVSGDEYVYRVFTSRKEDGDDRVALAMNLSKERLRLLSGSELDDFLAQ